MMRLETPGPRLETPERELARLPRHPGAGARPVRCQGRGGKCGQTLGVASGGYFFLRHEGREGTFTLPAEVRCERCGTRQMVA